MIDLILTFENQKKRADKTEVTNKTEGEYKTESDYKININL